MCNDFVVIGELKGDEAMDFFNGLYTGHFGYTTVHSDSAVETLDRLVILMKSSGTNYSRQDLKELLARTIDLVIYMKEFKIQEITEVILTENNTASYNTLFKYNGSNDLKVSGQTFSKVNNLSERLAAKLNFVRR
jgi:pilus assembly protein CpaF